MQMCLEGLLQQLHVPCAAASAVLVEQSECQDSRHLKFRITACPTETKALGQNPERVPGVTKMKTSEASHLISFGFTVAAV